MQLKSLPRIHRSAAYLLYFFALIVACALLYSLSRRPEALSDFKVLGPWFVLYAVPAAIVIAGLVWLAHTRHIPQVLSAFWIILLGVAVYGIEIIIAPASNESLRKQAAAAHGYQYDDRTRPEVLTDLQAQGIDARFFFRPLKQDLPLIPLAASPKRHIIQCNEVGPWVTYDSDRHGFRNPDAIWDQNSLDIAMIGDSFVHGDCVPVEKSFVSLIRAKHSRTVNLGTGGNGPLANLATLVEFAPLLKPSLVVWVHFNDNDFIDLADRLNTPLARYLTPGYSQSLSSKTDVVGSLFERLWLEHKDRLVAQADESRARDHRKWKDIARLATLRKTLGLTHDFKPVSQGQQVSADLIETYGLIVSRAKSIVDDIGGRLIVVLLPSVDEVSVWPPPEVVQLKIQLNVLGVPVHDYAESLRRSPDYADHYAFGRRGGHLSVTGHTALAKYILALQ